MEKATFAAGCFWGIEAEFASIEGVKETTVGYIGGTADNPTYEEVCSGLTGHAEAVEILFDSEIISYDDLLHIFWEIHDPTSLNRQGLDVGSQYRSVIFYHNDEQQQKALKQKQKLEAKGVYVRPIVTEIVPAQKFYRAEDYHQKYYMRKGSGGCQI